MFANLAASSPLSRWVPSTPKDIAIDLVLFLGFGTLVVWLLWRALKRSEDPARLIFKWVLTLIFTAGLLGYAAWVGFDNLAGITVPFLCVLYAIAMSILWAPYLGSWLASPLTAMYDGGSAEPDPEPLYAVATSLRKNGKYNEAIKEVRRQLQKFPKSFAGQMMIAEIQAEDIQDLPSAEVTVQKLCQQKGHKPAAISAALLRLADWQLKYWQDIEAARRSLEQIQMQFPRSEFAQVAAQRLAHMASREHLLSPHERPKIQLRHGLDDVGLRDEPLRPTPPPENLAEKAAQLTRHLEEFPNDAEAREQLAMIYAEEYHRIDYAVNELEQIIQQPGQTPKEIVRALNLIADVHIKAADDYEAASAALQRIIDHYPHYGAAEAAHQRLLRLKLEFRAKEKTHTVKLGSYEDDLGLKGKTPAPPREID